MSFLKKLVRNPIFIGIICLLWFIFRTGTKPSRIIYPCQRASASISFHLLFYPLIAFMISLLKNFLRTPLIYAQKFPDKRTIYVLLTLFSLTFTSLAIYANIAINPLATIRERTKLTEKKTSVSIVRVNNSLEEAVKVSIDLISGLDSYVPPNSKVLIKPNIVRNQEPPDTTDPAIVEALINLIKRKNPSIIWIAEGSGEGDTLENFEALGYSSIAERTGAVLVDLNKGETVGVPVPGGGVVFESFLFNKIVMEPDVFISLACMKTHSQAVVTLTMKNLIGITPGSIYGYQPSPTRVILHEKAAEKGDQYMAGVIVDLCRARRIDLAIIDGRVSMEGQGPHEGTPVKLDILIVGSDPVATDTVASIIMGFDPEKVPTLKLANQLGLGTNNLHEIEVKGEKIENVYHPFKPAIGHENFQLFTTVENELYKLRDTLIYICVILWAITLLSVILRAKRK